MRHKYNGPNIDELPEELRGRIREAANVAETETGTLGIIVSEITELYNRIGADELWGRFGDSREVFVYDFGGLHKVHFRAGDKVYELSFCGSSTSDEMEKVEKALGLNVVKRPINNQDEAEIRIHGDTLERLVGIGHQPNAVREDYSKYQGCASGPYMARK